MAANEMDKKFIELLREALKARLKTPSLPPKLNMEPHKEYILRLTGTIDNPFRPGTRFFTVINLEDGMEYRLPPNFQLEQILKDAKLGDYVLLIYLGSVQTAKQRTVKQYAGAILSSEEVAEMLKEISGDKVKERVASTGFQTYTPPQTPVEADKEQEELEEELSLEQPSSEVEKAEVQQVNVPASTQAEVKQLNQKEEEVRRFIEALVEVYGSIKVSEVDYYINKVKKMGVEITPEVLERLGFVVENNRVRLKK